MVRKDEELEYSFNGSEASETMTGGGFKNHGSTYRGVAGAPTRGTAGKANKEGS